MQYYLRLKGEKGKFVEENKIDRLIHNKVVKALVGPFTDNDIKDLKAKVQARNG